MITKLHVAYGLPASGKTTLLKTIPGQYFDYDKPDKIHNVKEFIKSLGNGEFIVDFLLRKPNEFVKFFFNTFPEGQLNIYYFKTNKDICLKRDEQRRNKSSAKLIKNMILEQIKEHTNLNVEVRK